MDYDISELVVHGQDAELIALLEALASHLDDFSLSRQINRKDEQKYSPLHLGMNLAMN